MKTYRYLEQLSTLTFSFCLGPLLETFAFLQMHFRSKNFKEPFWFKPQPYDPRK